MPGGYYKYTQIFARLQRISLSVPHFLLIQNEKKSSSWPTQHRRNTRNNTSTAGKMSVLFIQLFSTFTFQSRSNHWLIHVHISEFPDFPSQKEEPSVPYSSPGLSYGFISPAFTLLSLSFSIRFSPLSFPFCQK